MLKVHLLNNLLFPKEIEKKNISNSRIQIFSEEGRCLDISLISKKILDHKPGFDLLNWLGLRKRVILQIQDDSQKQEGYIAVNAESLRKQLHLDKKEFYLELKKNENEDLTSFVEDQLKTYQYQEPKKEKGPLAFIKRAINAYNINNAKKLNTLGLDYLIGRNGKEQNDRLAFEFFQKAARKNNLIGYENLAYCYSHGKGVSQNSEQVKTALLQILSHLDLDTQQLFLLSFAKRGIKEVEDLIENNPKIQLILAEGYLKGTYELPLNEEKAIQLFQKAANADHPQGFENLAFCYSKGVGTAKDSIQALASLKGMVQAAQKSYGKYSPNEIAVGLTRLEKLGIPEIQEIGQENPKLFLIMGKKFMHMAQWSPQQIDQEYQRKAFQYFQKAAEGGQIEAHAYLAYCFDRGLGVEKNDQKVREEIEKIHHLANSISERERLLNKIQKPNFYDL